MRDNPVARAFVEALDRDGQDGAYGRVAARHVTASIGTMCSASVGEAPEASALLIALGDTRTNTSMPEAPERPRRDERRPPTHGCARSDVLPGRSSAGASTQ
jgi:hypothetical protein